MAETYIKGKVEGFRREGRGPAIFKVGATTVKAWPTNKDNGVDTPNPAFAAAAAADLDAEYVARVWSREETFTAKQGPNAGQEMTKTAIYAVGLAPAADPTAQEWLSSLAPFAPQTPQNGSGGHQNGSGSTGKDQGMISAQWAIGRAVDLICAGKADLAQVADLAQNFLAGARKLAAGKASTDPAPPAETPVASGDGW